MKIAFIGHKKSNINFFDDLAKELSKKISGLELEKRFVPFVEDLPEMAREATEESDLVFVFAAISDQKKADLIKEKLIDAELATKTRILKGIENEDFDSLEEGEYDEQKEALVKKYADLIEGILFNEERFEPEDKDFSS